jgi:MscS family membrane protein
MFENFLNELFGSQPPDTTTRLILVAAFIILTWIAQGFLRRVIVRILVGSFKAAARISRLEIAFEQDMSRQIAPPLRLMIVSLGLRLALAFLDLAAPLAVLADQIVATIVTVSIFWVLYQIMEVIAQYYISHAREDGSRLDETLIRFGRQIVISVIVVFVFTLVLQRWGLDVGGLFAGLGIASLAVALAAQDALANIIAYVAIVLDAPFKVGDSIALDNQVVGRIQEISFRSTRIRTRDNSLMVIPNQTIANARVINWARVRKRRIDIKLGITYSTTPDQIQAVLASIREMLASHEAVTQDRFVVEFVEFGESSLNLQVYFLVTSPTWEDFQAIRTDINLRLMQILQQHGVSMAFPTRSIYIENGARHDPETEI